MGQDTETMSRYTLPTGATTETITFKLPKVNVNQVLSANMKFNGDRTHELTMHGYGEGSNFADGLEIVDTEGKLTTLTLALDSGWPEGWTITVDPNTVLTKGGQPFAIQPESKDWEISVVISNGTITTGDPKIKVIRPTS